MLIDINVNAVVFSRQILHHVFNSREASHSGLGTTFLHLLKADYRNLVSSLTCSSLLSYWYHSPHYVTPRPPSPRSTDATLDYF